jgi:hypothetical protein
MLLIRRAQRQIRPQVAPRQQSRFAVKVARFCAHGGVQSFSMLQYVQYYGRFQTMRGRVTKLPGWSRVIIFIFAIPGILLLSLSILAVLVSILALLLLTVPVYRLFAALLLPQPASRDEIQQGGDFGSAPEFVTSNPNRRHIDVKIVE